MVDLPTSITEIDAVLGYGRGYPSGGLTVIQGGPASGKTRMMLRSAEHARDLGFKPLFIDTELGTGEYFRRHSNLEPRAVQHTSAVVDAKRMFLSLPHDILIIDTLSHLHADFRILGDFIRDLRAHALRADIPVVVGMQINRNRIGRKAGPPNELVREADLIMQINRASDGKFDVELRKNRHGRTQFIENASLFGDYTPPPEPYEPKTLWDHLEECS